MKKLQLKRLINVILILLKSRKEFFKPSQCEILIYDATFPNHLISYLEKYRYSILPTRGESINLIVLLRAILKMKFSINEIFRSYIDSYIEITNPSVILTFIDNNPKFYLLKVRFESKKTIFIQNGVRTMAGDVFGIINQNEEYFVDYMLVHNEEIGKKYKQYISGEILSIGSFLNNALPQNVKAIRNRIVFVSQFYPKFEFTFGSEEYWNEFYDAERACLKSIKKWCIENGKDLVVAGRSSGKDDLEKRFFENQLGSFSFTYVPHRGYEASYALVSSAELTIFIDSTLGFEALARGIKVACFSVRSATGVPQYRFGWPAQLPANGPFWTNEINEDIFIKILDYIDNLSPKEWDLASNKFKPIVMEFDPGNSKLTKLIDELLEK
jgi:surface carbohydrate biosynthesis protein